MCVACSERVHFNGKQQAIENPKSLLKRRVEMNHRTGNRHANQSPYSQVGEPGGMGFSRSKPGSIGEANRSFAQDFNMEHSRSGAGVGVKNISNGSGAADPGSSRTAHADPLHSLSCVYLG
jgi:hypothetical protein